MVAITLITTSLISLPVVLLLILNYIEWTPIVTVLAFTYFGCMFAFFQILYNAGAKKHALKLQSKATEMKLA
jgi:hypothetical protein